MFRAVAAGMALVAMLAGTAFADPAAVVTPVASTAPNPHELVCRHLPNTGSLLPGPKVCHERWQWDEIQRQSQEEMHKAQNHPGAHPG